MPSPVSLVGFREKECVLMCMFNLLSSPRSKFSPQYSYHSCYLYFYSESPSFLFPTDVWEEYGIPAPSFLLIHAVKVHFSTYAPSRSSIYPNLSITIFSSILGQYVSPVYASFLSSSTRLKLDYILFI
jgi:hypothetical protein